MKQEEERKPLAKEDQKKGQNPVKDIQSAILREREWGDRTDEEDKQPEPYEETYRDGSMKNECW